MSGEEENCGKYRWKGKFGNKKQYKRMLQRRECGKMRKGYRKNLDMSETEIRCNVRGNRIVDLAYMSKNMNCAVCNARLDLQYIEQETIRGAASIFSIRCHECLLVNTLKTGEEYTNPVTGNSVFAINTKLALGAIHTGVGETHLSKFFSVLDLPPINSHTFKKHERIIGPIIEEVAKESCSEATAMERLLTMESIEELKKQLPEDLQEGYLIINVDNDGSSTPIVRVFASFDMGWGQRGNGHSYDSLNGYCSLIGLKTGKILDYCTRNRKCRTCDHELHIGTKIPHDCRRNFTGSAKAMEADGAVQLVTKSKILKEHNVQIGVFIGDNDSCSISSIQKEIDYPIVKQSDVNHSYNNVGSMLYALQKTSDPDKELSGDVIKYIQRCFTYAIHQNKTKIDGMKNALENIPYHLFDLHRNCGDWCKSKNDKENSTSIILKNPSLFDDLLKMFDELSENAFKFVGAPSSQANESLNNSMCHKNPKGFVYSTTESTDYRFGATVAEKNYGGSYLQRSLDKAGINHKEILNKHIVKIQKISLVRKKKASTPAFKRDRLELKAKRSQLRYRKENSEGEMYRSSMVLLDKSTNVDKSCIQIVAYNSKTFQTNDIAILFFDLETAGLSLKNEILQICVKFEHQIFKSFITPTQLINSAASKINGLTKVHKKLFQNGVEVATMSQRLVFTKLLDFLKSINKKCLLVAHNCTFDSSRLILVLKKLSLLEEYEKVLEGFNDSLSLFKKKYPKRENGYKLTTLAADFLSLSSEGAHDACFDVSLLEKLSTQFLSVEEIIESKKTVADIVTMLDNNENTQKLLPSFSHMEGIISTAMIKRVFLGYKL